MLILSTGANNVFLLRKRSNVMLLALLLKNEKKTDVPLKKNGKKIGRRCWSKRASCAEERG